jgi:hypothetical protein
VLSWPSADSFAVHLKLLSPKNVTQLVNLSIRLCTDFISTNVPILPGVKISIQLTKSTNNFIIQNAESDEYFIKEQDKAFIFKVTPLIGYEE